MDRVHHWNRHMPPASSTRGARLDRLCQSLTERPGGRAPWIEWEGDGWVAARFSGLVTSALLKPIECPGKATVCMGINYAGRNAEYKDAADQQKYSKPCSLRLPGILVAPKQPALMRPPESVQFDYEGELAVMCRASRSTHRTGDCA